MLHRFSIHIAELLTRASRGELVREEDLAGEATLVFSRNHHGKVYVAELDTFTVSVLENVGGERNVHAIAEALGVSAAAVQRQLSTLRELGAVILPSAVLVSE
jgi:DNA-binding transcriptional ArsR family regulator